MFVSDMAMIMDPEYLKVSKHFYENQEEFGDAFARAWFKLTHRDMGPITRYLGSEVPTEKLIWQDNVPEKDLNLIPTEDKIKEIKGLIRSSGLTIPQLVETAWASAST